MSPLQAAPSELLAEFAVITYPSQTGPTSAPIDGLFSQTWSRALLVLHDDTLLVERYSNGSSHAATQTSFSMAELFTSTLIGVAIADGAIGSVDDLVIRYVPELAGYGLQDLSRCPTLVDRHGSVAG